MNDCFHDGEASFVEYPLAPSFPLTCSKEIPQRYVCWLCALGKHPTFQDNNVIDQFTRQRLVPTQPHTRTASSSRLDHI